LCSHPKSPKRDFLDGAFMGARSLSKDWFSVLRLVPILILVLNYLVAYEHLLWCSVRDPTKIFFTSKFSYLVSCNPTCETETGTSNRWETTNSKPPGLIIMMDQSEIQSNSQVIFVTPFCMCTSHSSFYQRPQTVQSC
jgi:hypothetical protein